MQKPGRNAPCPCGSGKKYKKCCLHKENVIQVQEKASKLMQERRFAEAEELLLELLREEDHVTIRNNLATSIFEQGRPRDCLQILDPCLQGEREELLPNPYTLAVAARALAQLGETEDALACLERAEKTFEAGIAAYHAREAEEDEMHSWREYTVIIMRAAGDLEEHRRVLELKRRWKSEHVNWETDYLAAVASYNLKEFRKAASFLGEVARHWPPAYELQRAVLMVERGAAPFFTLNYQLSEWLAIQEELNLVVSDEAYFRELMKSSSKHLFFLAVVFSPETGEQLSSHLTRKMVYYGGDWGVEFGKSLLKSQAVTPSLKMAAAQGLVDKGVYNSDDPIPAVINGEEREIKFKELDVVEEPDEEIKRAMQEAARLKEENRLEEAIQMLLAACQKDKFFPPAAINLSNLLRQADRLDQAQSYLQMVEKIAPEDPLMLFNTASLKYDQGRMEEAREYLQRLENLDTEEITEEISEKMDLLDKNITAWYQAVNGLAGTGIREGVNSEETLRKKIEEKSLPTDAPLYRCLKNMPAHWLKGICYSLGLPHSSRREEREAQIRRALPERDNLRPLLQKLLDQEDRQLLVYLLEKGGWSRMTHVTRKFGSMKGDGFYWEHELPNSPPAVLWSLGLAAIGRTQLGQRKEKIITVPRELKHPLSELLGVETATEGSSSQDARDNQGTLWDYLPEGEDTEGGTKGEV